MFYTFDCGAIILKVGDWERSERKFFWPPFCLKFTSVGPFTFMGLFRFRVALLTPIWGLSQPYRALSPLWGRPFPGRGAQSGLRQLWAWVLIGKFQTLP